MHWDVDDNHDLCSQQHQPDNAKEKQIMLRRLAIMTIVSLLFTATEARAATVTLRVVDQGGVDIPGSAVFIDDSTLVSTSDTITLGPGDHSARIFPAFSVQPASRSIAQWPSLSPVTQPLASSGSPPR